MKIDLEVLDTSMEIRTTVNKNKVSILEMYMFLPNDMGILERDINANILLDLKASRYHYSISKAKFPLLKQTKTRSDSTIDFPIFLKTFKLKLSRLLQEVRKNKTDLSDYLKVARSLLNDLRNTPTTEETIKDFKSADEICAYYAEQITLAYCHSVKKGNQNTAIYDELIKFACAEREYRREHYGLRSKEAQYIRRKENYFCKSININQKNNTLGLVRQQIAFSISAFLSMLLTTLVVFYVQLGYGTLSLALLMTICFSYIFKDRFKELFRTYIAKKLSKGKYRIKTILYDIHDKAVGQCYDLAEFKVPDEEIIAVRGKGKYTKKEAGEAVIYYKKKYEMNDKFMNGFTQVRDTMDINLHSLLGLLPDTTLRHTSYEQGKLIKNKFSMLHDINLIFRLNNNKIERYRIKVTHSNIAKLEPVNWS
ncbi:hypothetical protein [Vibrio sp. MA40-2]|uniref:hypothetical protein n=1 Tax=Vibrio sp. MA40-2 TaxID=3391828 RepID=UPI0039A677F2